MSKIVVIFEVKPKKENMDDYLNHAVRLKEELSRMEGFVSAERFSSLNEEGKLISLSVWESEQAAAKWRNHMAHRQSQKTGHESLFEEYHITVASVLREYNDKNREHAPEDSNNHLNLK